MAGNHVIKLAADFGWARVRPWASLHRRAKYSQRADKIRVAAARSFVQRLNPLLTCFRAETA